MSQFVENTTATTTTTTVPFWIRRNAFVLSDERVVVVVQMYRARCTRYDIIIITLFGDHDAMDHKYIFYRNLH